MTEPTDSEYQGFSAEAKYRYLERIGMICDDRPVSNEADAIARSEARKWDVENSDAFRQFVGLKKSL